MFSETAPFFCGCHQLVDHFGDHFIGCSHGPLCIRHHDALCDIIYFAVLGDNSDKSVKNKECLVSRLSGVFHLDFHCGCPTYFDISVWNALHSDVLMHSVFSTGFAARKGEMKKDVWHCGLVEVAGFH